MPLQATSGAASYDGFGGGAAVVPTYIEEIFSTYLYTGNGSTQTITNGIDLSDKGGLVWTKLRTDAFNHVLIDTVRGGTGACVLNSNTTGAASSGNQTNLITPFNSNGYTIATDWSELNSGTAGRNYVSWTFRKQPKFFDVVTYTGTGVNNRQISHNLGSVPGFMVVKSTSNVDNFQIYHRSISPINKNNMALNRDSAFSSGGQDQWGDGTTVIPPTSAVFTVGVNNNQSGYTYVIYLFAHDAGGFGLEGTDNVISCGSFTTDINGDFSPVTLGYEPQWLMFKRSSGVDNWVILDNMRGIPTGSEDAELKANLSNAETTAQRWADLTSTGFKEDGGLDASSTYIYIAIRRGPMKVPTLGTSVFLPTNIAAGVSSITTGFPVDATLQNGLGGGPTYVFDRLRGSAPTSAPYLRTTTTGAESNISVGLGYASNTTIYNLNNWGGGIYYNLKRAPGFFDEVCYTGTGSATTQTHNLGAVPELMIVKDRTYDWGSDGWAVYSSALGATKYLALARSVGEQTSSSFWNNTAPTSSVFTVGTIAYTNAGADKYVAYLFATCAGVSKCTSFTGTGTLQTIDCGFTSGSRFVLIKRTDSTGDWYVWDSSRGLSSSTDPYLLLNSTAAEVTSTNWVDTTSTGFQVTAASGNNVNINGASYIGLAIA